MSGEQAESMKITSDFEGLLINYKKKGYTAALLGKETVDSIETYKLAFTNTAGDSVYCYLNTSTYLIIKRARYSSTKKTTTETYTSEYKKFENIILPVLLEIKQGGDDDENSQKITFDKVEINKTVKDDIFKMPEEK